MVREKRQLDYYSLVDDYDDMDEFDDEQLYLANDGDDAFVNDDGNVYGYDELDEPAVEPLDNCQSRNIKLLILQFMRTSTERERENL